MKRFGYNARRLRGASSIALLVAVLAVPAASAGEEPDEEQKKQALELGHDALTKFEKGEWAEARELFIEADRIAHSPVFVLYRARAEKHLGELLAARETYRSLVAREVPPGSPPAWAQSQRDARAELAALAPHIPSISVRILGVYGVEARLDGVRIAQGGWVELDPGKYVVTAHRDGREVWRKSVDLREGMREEVVTSLRESDVKRGPSQGGESTWWPGVVLLGAGGASLLVGGVTGGIAAGKASDLKDACGDDDVCPKALEGDGDSAETLALVSTVGFVVGGVAAGAGITWLIVDPGGEGSEPTDATVGLSFGVGGASLSGRF